MTFPDDPLEIRVEIQFGAVGWVDVTGDVADQTISLRRGRSDEASSVQPSTLEFELDNLHGDYTPGRAESAWWPHVGRGAPVRFAVRWDGSWRTRFTGRVASWQPIWPAGDTPQDAAGQVESRAAVTAAGVLRRLGQGDEPRPSTLRRQIMAFQDDPRLRAYWPLEDGRDTDGRAVSPLEGVPPMVVGGSVTWGGDSESIPGAAQMVTAQAPWGLNGRVPPTPNGTWRTEWVAVPRTPTTGTARMLAVQLAGASPFTQFDVLVSDTDLHLRALVGDTVFGTISEPADIHDQPTFFRLGANQGGTSARFFVQAWVGGSLVAEVSTTSVSGGQVGRVSRVLGWSNAELEEPLSLGHILVRTAPVNPVMLTSAAMTGHDGERAATRFTRLCEENEIDAAVVGDPEDTPRMGPQRPAPLLDLFFEIEAADRGVIYEPMSEHDLVLRTRESMLNQVAAFELDASTRLDGDAVRSDLADPFAPTDDDQALVNHITVSRPRGSQVTLSDEASIEENRKYDDSVTVNVETDDQLLDQAGWRLHLGTWGEMRYPSLSPDLMVSPQLIDDWLSVDIGDRADVSGLPPQHPAADVSQLVQGWSEKISPALWAVTANTSPARPFQVGVLDDDGDPPNTALARLDTTRSELAVGVDETETGLSVAVVEGPRWVDSTAHADEFPLSVEVGGEVMEVSAIGALVEGDPLTGAGHFEDTTASTSHAVPAVSAVGTSDLHLAAACSFVEPGTYTGLDGMTSESSTTGVFSTMAAASEMLAASGSTGGRTFTFSDSDVWSSLAVIAHGAASGEPVVEEVQSDVSSGTASEGPDPIEFTTSPEAGERLLVVQAWDWDPGNTMAPPDSDLETWDLVADSIEASDATSRVQLWERRITDPGEITVTVNAESDQWDLHAALIRLSGVTEEGQAFTVARSVNGVSKSHSAGARVRVAEPIRLV